MRACATCGRENPEDSRFCNGCGATLDAPAPRREERKVVSVLFADLVGFTAQAERLDPEDVRALLAPYWEHLRDELERYGGTVEKFIGDAVMALFGAPVAHEDDPERAVRAALAIRDWARDEPNLQVRIAVNTGEALVMLGASAAEGEGMAAGDVVNTAARLQSAAPVNGVLVGEMTYRATRNAVEYVEHEAVAAKGKSEPLRVWEAVEARSRVTIERLSTAPLAGRQDEVELLANALQRVRRDREPQLVTVAGVPGIGKSRLVAELFALVEADAEFITWRRGRCLSYGEGASLWALGEIAKAEAGVLESDTGEETASKLAASLAELAPDEDERAWLEHHLAPLVGLAAEQVDRAERFGAWRRWIELLAERYPLVLVFEDIQWADDELLDFVDDLAEWASDIPLLVVCTARPELFDRRPGWGGGKRNVLTVSLGPLSDADTARIVAAALDRSLLPAETQAALLERAAGNPLYAEQYARMVAEGARADELPETVQGIVAARLDLLAADEKALLQDAAVVGRAFWPSAVGATDDLLRSLARKEFVRRERRSSVAGEQEYAFAHALVRDVAYAQIPRADRAAKHRAAATWIETLPPDRAADRAEMLAHHYGAALDLTTAAGASDEQLTQRARAAFKDAAERALTLTAFSAAQRHFEAALALASEEDADYAALLLGLGLTLAAHDPTAALGHLTDAAARFAAAGDAEQAAVAEQTAAATYWSAGNRDEADAHSARAVELLADAAISEAKVEAVAQRARLLFLGGQHSQAVELATSALAWAEELGSERLQASALITRGTARGDRDDLVLGTDVAERSKNIHEFFRGLNNLAEGEQRSADLAATLALYVRYRHEAEQVGAWTYLSWIGVQEATVRTLTGEWDRALELVDPVISAGEAGKPHYMEGEARHSRAIIRHARGDAAGALEDARRCVEKGRLTKDPQTIVPALAAFAEMLAREGQVHAAGEALGEVLEICAALENLYYSFGLSLLFAVLELGVDARFAEAFGGADDPWTRATVTAWRGDLAAAADSFGAYGAVTPEAELRLRLAAQLRSAGDRAGADTELQRALAFFRSVGATRRIRDAEALLAATA